MRDLATRVAQNPVLFMACRSVLENGFRQVRRLIRRELRADADTLELGCGTGAFSDLFTGAYTGIDLNARYIAHARARQQGTFLHRDATDIGDVGVFDQVLIFGLLHHLSDAQADAVLREAHRSLSDDGIALVMEDIPTVANGNVIGHLLHRVDGGSFIRSCAEYSALYARRFTIERQWTFRSGVCDYSASVLRP